MALEAAWKKDPDSTLEQLAAEVPQQELLRVALKYADAFEYQNVLAPLLQIEADYDKVCCSALACCCAICGVVSLHGKCR